MANLTRNVVTESADPKGERGHTMYHRNSAGSISYTEFRHLGKEGVLGRYALHFHLVRDTMRQQRRRRSFWIRTTAGSPSTALITCVRDCVGYRSIGHSASWRTPRSNNVLDRNLAVEVRQEAAAEAGIAVRCQRESRLLVDNGRNTLTRNVSATATIMATSSTLPRPRPSCRCGCRTAASSDDIRTIRSSASGQ